MPVAVNPDGTKIAYEAVGDGPPLLLLHGGTQSRRVWFDAGYADALKASRRVIAVDARGHGESDKPTSRSDYAIERVMADMLAVADAEGAARFDLVGYSYGGNIGRYLASRTDRVVRFVFVGIGFGRGAPESMRDRVQAMLAPFAAVLGPEPNPDGLDERARAAWDEGSVRPILAWFGALLDWPAVEPQDLRCPTLWLVGTENERGALDSVARHGRRLPPNVRLQMLPGLNHAAELERSDMVLPHLKAFLKPGQGVA